MRPVDAAEDQDNSDPPAEEPTVFDITEDEIADVRNYYSDGQECWSDFQLNSVNVDEADSASAEDGPAEE